MPADSVGARIRQLRDDRVTMSWKEALTTLLTTTDEDEAMTMYIWLAPDVSRRIDHREDAARILEGMRASITSRFGRVWDLEGIARGGDAPVLRP